MLCLLQSGPSTKSGLNTCVYITVGQQELRSNVSYHSNNPCWHESFQFLLGDPEKERITLEVNGYRKFTDTSLHFQVVNIVMQVP